MIQAAAIALAAGAFVLWLQAVRAALGMMRHRKPGVSRLWFATNGYAFFTGRNFGPGAEPWRKRLTAYAAGFFVAIVAGLALAAVSATVQPS